MEWEICWPGLKQIRCLTLSEGLIKAAKKSNKIDITVFTESKNPQITVTYLEVK